MDKLISHKYNFKIKDVVGIFNEVNKYKNKIYYSKSQSKYILENNVSVDKFLKNFIELLDEFVPDLRLKIIDVECNTFNLEQKPFNPPIYQSMYYTNFLPFELLDMIIQYNLPSNLRGINLAEDSYFLHRHQTTLFLYPITVFGLKSLYNKYGIDLKEHLYSDITYHNFHIYSYDLILDVYKSSEDSKKVSILSHILKLLIYGRSQEHDYEKFLTLVNNEKECLKKAHQYLLKNIIINLFKLKQYSLIKYLTENTVINSGDYGELLIILIDEINNNYTGQDVIKSINDYENIIGINLIDILTPNNLRYYISAKILNLNSYIFRELFLYVNQRSDNIIQNPEDSYYLYFMSHHYEQIDYNLLSKIEELYNIVGSINNIEKMVDEYKVTHLITRFKSKWGKNITKIVYNRILNFESIKANKELHNTLFNIINE